MTGSGDEAGGGPRRPRGWCRVTAVPDDGTAGTRTAPRPGGELDEGTLVARARDGDVRTFEDLVRRYQAPMFHLALRMLANRGDDATRLLVEEPVEPPTGLTERIMLAVRAEVRRPGMVPLTSTEKGPVEVSEQAIAVVLRYAADMVDGVRARRCTIRRAGQDEHGVAVLSVKLSLALAYGTGPADQVLRAVRRQVAELAGARIGVRIAACDLVLEDVYAGPRPGG